MLDGVGVVLVWFHEGLTKTTVFSSRSFFFLSFLLYDLRVACSNACRI